MTDDELKALRAAAEKATLRRWLSVDGVLENDDEGNSRSYIKPVPNEGWQIAQTCGPNGAANAKFIAAANPAAILSLLDRVAAAETENKRMREAHSDAPAPRYPQEGIMHREYATMTVWVAISPHGIPLCSDDDLAVCWEKVYQQSNVRTNTPAAHRKAGWTIRPAKLVIEESK